MINLEFIKLREENENMPFKERTEPKLLKRLRILNTRMDLTEDMKNYYQNQEKGFEGEVKFDLLTEKLPNNCYVLNDLLLETNNSEHQIDTSIIYQETFYLLDVKNFEGDFCYDTDKFLMKSGKEIKNPLIQLERSKSLLRQLLQNLGYHFTIEAYVIFINPEFTLYQTPLNLPFVFPTQINRFMNKLNLRPSRLTTLHNKLANQLVALHQTESNYSKLPPYEYHQLRKGCTCKLCNSFSLFVRGYSVVCNECGFKEPITSAIMRCVEEIKLLFPNRKITTNEIHEWFGVVESSKRIRRVLGKNLQVGGVGQWTFYE
jgi:hypothetical protein